MRVVVRTWGNSAAVRIPAAVMRDAGLDLGQPVDVREEAGRVIIEPIRALRPNLDALIAGITPENRHETIDFGRPEGREAM